MKLKLSTLFLGAAAMLSSCGAPQDVKSEKSEMRAPAYPLVMIDPYTSAWSFTDNLYDGPVKHWTGKDFPFLGVAKVDGQIYRFMGTEELELLPLVKTSEQGRWTAKYTTKKPADGWQNADFNDAAWKEGEGLSVLWRMKVQPRPSGEKSISGYAVKRILKTTCKVKMYIWNILTTMTPSSM